MKKGKFYVVIDIGGTYAKVASLNSLDKPILKNITSFKLSHNFEKDFNKIKRTIFDFSKQKITAIAVGLPGDLDKGKTKIISKYHVPEWKDKNIKQKLSHEFECDIYLENDAVTSALGEVFFSKGTKKEDFIFLIWGTGVGGAMVNIKPNLKVEKLNHRKYLGRFEQKVGGENLAKKYHKLPSKLTEKEWASVMSVFEKEITNLSKKLSVKNIVIGGGIALRQKSRIISLSKKLKKNNGINLQMISLGDSTTFGLYGSAGLIKEQMVHKTTTKAVLFDIDGVLLDSFEANLQYYTDTMKKFVYKTPTQEEFKNLFYKTSFDVIKILTKESAKEVKKLLKRRRKISYPHHLLKIPEKMKETIKILSKNYMLGIVTSRTNNPFENPILKNLKKYFNIYIGFRDTKKHKPDPEPLILAARKLNLMPEECVYIGDVEHHDIKAAKAAGMKSILFSKDKTSEADAKTFSFQELPELIKTL